MLWRRCLRRQKEMARVTALKAASRKIAVYKSVLSPKLIPPSRRQSADGMNGFRFCAKSPNDEGKYTPLKVAEPDEPLPSPSGVTASAPEHVSTPPPPPEVCSPPLLQLLLAASQLAHRSSSSHVPPEKPASQWHMPSA